MSDNYTSHYSVLKKECLDSMSENAQDGEAAYYADLTFGGGGHTLGLLNLSPDSYTVSFDQDPDALANGRALIEKSGVADRANLVASNFENFPNIAKEKFAHIFEEHGGFQGILMDLGVSSHHFDKGERGFSFRSDAPLDMRMNYADDSIQTAEYLVNNLSEEELRDIIDKYGEEKFAYQIAKNIVETRIDKPIRTTKDLENVIFHSYPKKMRFGKINPSTKTFQALRIAVNRELEVLENTIRAAIPLLKVGGRLAIISFHSLEDRIVKSEFKSFKSEDILCRVLTKKPIIPTDKEINENSRSRSAKLRVIERISIDMLSDKEKRKLKYQGIGNGH